MKKIIKASIEYGPKDGVKQVTHYGDAESAAVIDGMIAEKHGAIRNGKSNFLLRGYSSSIRWANETHEMLIRGDKSRMISVHAAKRLAQIQANNETTRQLIESGAIVEEKHDEEATFRVHGRAQVSVKRELFHIAGKQGFQLDAISAWYRVKDWVETRREIDIKTLNNRLYIPAGSTLRVSVIIIRRELGYTLYMDPEQKVGDTWESVPYATKFVALVMSDMKRSAGRPIGALGSVKKGLTDAT